MIDVDFGRLERYVESGGFGFVSHTLQNVRSVLRRSRRRTLRREPDQVSFLHISVAKRTLPELASALDRGDTTAAGKLYFWFEYKLTAKGREVVTILSLKEVRAKYSKQMDALEVILRERWANIGLPIPEAMTKVTENLFTPEDVAGLRSRRKELLAPRRVSLSVPAIQLYAVPHQGSDDEPPFVMQTDLRSSDQRPERYRYPEAPVHPGIIRCHVGHSVSFTAQTHR